MVSKPKLKFINQVEPWIGREESRLMARYLRSGSWLAEFEQTKEFEKKFANVLGADYAVAVSNGTVALILSLMALGIGRGDEVIVPDYTMIATANAVLMAGAKPVFADIEAGTLSLDLDHLPITKKTKAIIHVSINGRTGDIVELAKICQSKNIYLIEDSCQSFTSRYRGRPLGTFGEVGCFSLTPHKIITTGQGGMMVTNRKELYEKIKKLKNFGRLEGGGDYHETVGYNFRFSDLQAVIGLAQIGNLRERIKKKKELYQLYKDNLSEVKEVEFIKTDLAETTPMFMDVLVPAERRAKLMQFLKDHQIGSRAFYPSINSQPAYRGFTKHKFPVSAAISRRGLWLPSSLTLPKSEVNYICQTIKKFFHGF
ncbi:MAG: DegT/DnrJ/EryC1/StrS family aminotransferase [Candidatus Nealsonbacteria bacterium]|nr:DegT/DnrJ/EryC1/StrS family aminotransferase [Candidatus Nealsonbacteria bacterium]